MVQLLNITKQFDQKTVLSDLSLSVNRNEFVCITGESGVGKTTLLNLIGLLEKPDRGELILNGKKQFTKRDLLKLRRNFFGYVFQDYLLLPEKTVEENICISRWERRKTDRKELEEVMAKVGLDLSCLNKKVYH